MDDFELDTCVSCGAGLLAVSDICPQCGWPKNKPIKPDEPEEKVEKDSQNNPSEKKPVVIKNKISRPAGVRLISVSYMLFGISLVLFGIIYVSAVMFLVMSDAMGELGAIGGGMGNMPMLPGMDGIETARHLAQMDEPPAVIFTTAYGEYAVEAFDASAVGYVVKPVRRERLLDALRRASRLTRPQLASLVSREQHKTRKHISARIRGELRLVPVRDVIYFHADQKYVTVRYHDGELLIDEPIKELEDEFEGAFVRVHRSTLVAVAHIEALAKDEEGHYEIRLKGLEESFPVSRRLAPAVLQRLKEA